VIFQLGLTRNGVDLPGHQKLLGMVGIVIGNRGTQQDFTLGFAKQLAHFGRQDLGQIVLLVPEKLGQTV
jgi:hypothetical protein